MIKKATLLIAAIVLLVGCQTVRVSQDYAVGTDFNQFKTYGYFKQGIDEADINDLDKKRILKAIDDQMLTSGWTKSQTPDIMINIFTKTQQRVDVYNNWGGWNAGFGWGGWGGGLGWNNGFGGNNVNTVNEGILHIDFIDAQKRN
ncbi:lipoprotein [Nonlabens ulvanivorans]|nr:lipoprotein [Nonlabens ulvanivorans]